MRFFASHMLVGLQHSCTCQHRPHLYSKAMCIIRPKRVFHLYQICMLAILIFNTLWQMRSEAQVYLPHMSLKDVMVFEGGPCSPEETFPKSLERYQTIAFRIGSLQASVCHTCIGLSSFAEIDAVIDNVNVSSRRQIYVVEEKPQAKDNVKIQGRSA